MSAYRRILTQIGAVAMALAFALPPMPVDAAVKAPVRAAEAEAEEAWQPIGRLPFETTGMVADGHAIYASGNLDGRSMRPIRVPLQNGELGKATELTFPTTVGPITGLALGGQGLYAMTAEGREEVMALRTESPHAESSHRTWRSVVRLQGLDGWTATVSFGDRIWVSHAGRSHWLHWIDAPRAGRFVSREFNQGVYVGAPRRGAAIAATARSIYIIGGAGAERDVTAVPIVNNRPGTPKKLAQLPVGYSQAVAAVHGSMLYLIGAPGGEPRVDRATIKHDGTLENWTRLLSPNPGPPPVAVVSIQGQIAIARADGMVEALPVSAVSPGRRRINWSTATDPRTIAPGQTLTEVIPWAYDGPEDIDSFSAWTYATGKASRLADRGASLAGTHIRAGGGTGRELVLVITVPKDSKRRDYWSIIMLKSRGKSIGRVLRINHRNTACTGTLC